MNDTTYQCPKCTHDRYEADQFRATGGFWTKILDIQNKKFTTVSCRKCRYTEIYKADTSQMEDIFDWFTG